MRRAAFLSLTVVGLACSDPLSVELNEQKAVWNRLAISSYTVEQVRTCFCLNGGRAFRLTVVEDTITEVRAVDTDSVVPLSEREWFRTVDGLFALVAEEIGSDYATLEIEYNSEFGFPSRIYVDRDERIADEEFGYETSAFVGLN